MTISNPLIEHIQLVIEQGRTFKDGRILKSRKETIEKNFNPSFQLLMQRFYRVLQEYQNIQRISTITIDFTPIKESLLRLKEQIRQNNFDKILLTEITSALKETEKTLNNEWLAHIQKETAAITDVLDTLSEMIAGTTQKATLDALKTRFTIATIASPDGLKAISDYVSLANELLDTLNLNDDVLIFLKKLTNSPNGITLDELDEDVYHWLKDNGFSSKIKLRIC